MLQNVSFCARKHVSLTYSTSENLVRQEKIERAKGISAVNPARRTLCSVEAIYAFSASC